MATEFDEGYDVVSSTDTAQTLNYKDKDVFYKDVDMEEVDRVFGHIQNYVEAATKAASEKGADIFKENENVKDVTVFYPYGSGKNGEVGVHINRDEKDEISIRVGVKHEVMTPTKKRLQEFQDMVKSHL